MAVMNAVLTASSTLSSRLWRLNKALDRPPHLIFDGFFFKIKSGMIDPMDQKQNILSRFQAGKLNDPVFMPDLTLWYEWHKVRNTLPEKYKSHTMVKIAQVLGCPVWNPFRPWRINNLGVDIIKEESDNEKVIRLDSFSL